MNKTLIEEETTEKGFCFAAMWRKSGDSDESWGFGATPEEAKEAAFYFREDEGSGQSLGWGEWSIQYQIFDRNGHTVRVENLLNGTTIVDTVSNPCL